MTQAHTRPSAPARPSTPARSSTARAVGEVRRPFSVGPGADGGRMNQGSLPFIGTEALTAGTVTRRTLVSRNRMVYRNVYLPNGIELTPQRRAVAAWLWSQRNATVAGISAAALYGTRWIDSALPAELIRSEACDVDGIVIYRGRLRDDESCLVRGIPATTPARTAFDLGRRDRLETAIIGVDALANATGLKPDDVKRLAGNRRGARGTVQLRRVVELMDGGAESPQETRTRLLLSPPAFRNRRRRSSSWMSTVPSRPH